MPTFCVDLVNGSSGYDGSTLTIPYLSKNMLVFLGAASFSGSTTGTPTTDWNERLDYHNADSDCLLYIEDYLNYGGKNTTTTVVMSASTGTKGAGLVCLTPAGATPIAFVSTSVIGEADGSVDCPAPADILDDDILLALVWMSGTAASAYTPGFPLGWEQVGTKITTGGTASVVHIFWKRCNSESGAYTITNEATGAKLGVAIAAYRNCIATGTPFIDYSTGSYTSANTSLVALATQCAIPGPLNTLIPTGIAAGDTVKVAKTDDPISIGNATWTNGSPTVTLASAKTKNLSRCENNWTAKTYITSNAYSTGSALKEGSYCLAVVPASSFTTGQACWTATDETGDMSAYNAISFWCRPSADIAANTVRIDLHSSADGTGSPVNSFTITKGLEAGRWHCLTLTPDAGGSLDSNVNSMAIYYLLDPGTVNFYIDNILAVDKDVLSLSSLLSIDGSAIPDDCYYEIKSINGTTITLDPYAYAYVNITMNWVGDTDTYETFAINDFIPFPSASYPASPTGAIFSLVNTDGTSIAPFIYEFGCNTSTEEQDGITWFDFINNYGSLVVQSFYCQISNLGITRGGYLYAASEEFTSYKNIYLTGMLYGIYSNYSAHIENYYVGGAFNMPFPSSLNGRSIYNKGKIWGVYNGELFASHFGLSIPIILNDFKFWSFGEFVESSDTYCNIEIYNSDFKAYTKIGPTGATNPTPKFYNCTFDVDSFPTFNTDFYSPWIYINYNGVENDHREYSFAGIILSETTTRHTESGISWKLSPSEKCYTYGPLRMKVGSVAVSPGATPETITANVWVYRSGTSVQARLMVEHTCGVTYPTEDYAASSAEWEQLSIEVVPTFDGVLDFYVEVYGSGSEYIYVDDFSVSQS